MPEHPIVIPDTPLGRAFELVKKHVTEDFEKYRLSSSDITIDVSLVHIDEDERGGYVEQRKEDLEHHSTSVPHPYKAEVEEEEAEEPPVTFHGEDGHTYGLGDASPEYRLVVPGSDQLSRYTYLVTWRYFDEEELLAEVEIYVPEDAFDRDEALELADALKIREHPT